MVVNLWESVGLIRYFLSKFDELHLASHIERRVDVRSSIVVVLGVEIDGSKGLDVWVLFTNFLILEGVKVYYGAVSGVKDHHYCLVKAASLYDNGATI